MPTTYGSTEHIERMTGHVPSPATVAGPHEPWSASVMILAGVVEGHAWLWLGCRDCGWFLGFSAQYDPDALAAAAAMHREQCDAD